MKTISDYTIYCTESQTKKALELGAPIEYGKYCPGINAEILHKGKDCRREKKLYSIPTVEQMISWLEEQGLIEGITIGYAEGIEWFFDVNNLSESFISVLNFNSRKEATLAAIDAALEYLTNNNNYGTDRQ